MSPILDAEYVTVAEAARELKVSESTIWRWIDQGTLPAYRVGQRRVRLKGADVARLITPAHHSQKKGGATAQSERDRLSRPLTRQEKVEALAAIQAARRLRHDMLEQRGGKRFSDSSELLNDARDQRTHDLVQ